MTDKLAKIQPNPDLVDPVMVTFLLIWETKSFQEIYQIQVACQVYKGMQTHVYHIQYLPPRDDHILSVSINVKRVLLSVSGCWSPILCPFCFFMELSHWSREPWHEINVEGFSSIETSGGTNTSIPRRTNHNYALPRNTNYSFFFFYPGEPITAPFYPGGVVARIVIFLVFGDVISILNVKVPEPWRRHGWTDGGKEGGHILLNWVITVQKKHVSELTTIISI